MSDAIRFIPLRDLDRPSNATLYLWAPSGDYAVAHATNSISNSLMAARSKGWQSFSWAIPPKEVAFYEPGVEVAEMQMRIVVFVPKEFRHKHHPGAWAAQFSSAEDQALFLKELPHLAISREEVGTDKAIAYE